MSQAARASNSAKALTLEGQPAYIQIPNTLLA
jgi:hypothetical protein